ncbi:hypothetical protein QE152_g179 [Popillia japonica]|uniref:Uncharacterized protein n=1 Tax=Popillia japonica TaxID=7064 RepID=A0AAW1NHF0_POPJA
MKYNEKIQKYLPWDRTVLTDRTVAHNRPDITLTLKKKKTTYLVDVAVPAPANVKMKYNEKIQKYLPLSQDIRNTWQQEAEIHGSRKWYPLSPS